jgi:hypothetical protein
MNYAEDRSYECADSNRRPGIAPDPLIGCGHRYRGATDPVLNDAIRGGQRNIACGADLWDLGVRDVYDMPDQSIDAVRKFPVLDSAPVSAQLIRQRPVVEIDPHQLIV